MIWTTTLANHVEPRKTSPGRHFAFCAIAFLSALGLAFGLFHP